MKDKRTEPQKNFDLAKHGWAFSNDEGLARRIARCEEIAKELDAKDRRHESLQHMKQREKERRKLQ